MKANSVRSAMAAALRTGALSARPPTCAACGAAGFVHEYDPAQLRLPRAPVWSIVWHHHSYDRADWLNVTPVCRSCHRRIHCGQIPDPATGEIVPDALRHPNRENRARVYAARLAALHAALGSTLDSWDPVAASLEVR